jgi:hypothetical protein
MIDPASYREGLETAAKACEAHAKAHTWSDNSPYHCGHVDAAMSLATAIRALPVPEAPAAPTMTVTKEQRDELRRLHAAWQNAADFSDALNDYTDKAHDLAIPLLDALDAAEAERDRLREALKDPSNDEVRTAIKEYVDYVGPKHASMEWALKWFLECRRTSPLGDTP